MNTDSDKPDNPTAPIAWQSPQEVSQALDVRRAHIRNSMGLLRKINLEDIPSNSDRFATFIDFRRSPYTEFALRNTMFFLGKSWGLQIYIPQDIEPWMQRIVCDWKDVQVNILPVSSCDTGVDLINGVLKETEFWNNAPGEWQLVFNSDSMLCSNGIEQYMKYDFIGAPWPDHVISPWCRVGAGGLSLRRKQAMQEICKTCNTNPWIVGPEDAFFSVNMHLSPEMYRLPSPETAQRFAVERLFYPSPLGVHGAWRHIKAIKLESILDKVDYHANPY